MPAPLEIRSLTIDPVSWTPVTVSVRLHQHLRKETPMRRTRFACEPTRAIRRRRICSRRGPNRRWRFRFIVTVSRRGRSRCGCRRQLVRVR